MKALITDSKGSMRERVMEVEIRVPGDIRNGKWVRGKNQGRVEYFSLRGCFTDKIIHFTVRNMNKVNLVLNTLRLRGCYPGTPI